MQKSFKKHNLMADFFKTLANLLRKNKIIWVDFYLNLAKYFFKKMILR
jgi:hypothetical protein